MIALPIGCKGMAYLLSAVVGFAGRNRCGLLKSVF